MSTAPTARLDSTMGGSYSNIFGESLSEELREMGWVMWDAGRIEHTSCKEYLLNYCVEDHDPRTKYDHYLSEDSEYSSEDSLL